MKITQNNFNTQIPFKAKFLYSDDLQKVVGYAMENGLYPKLDKARLNIDENRITTRIMMNLDSYNGKPVVIFLRYKPRYTVAFPNNVEKDYSLRRQVKYISIKEKNPLKFACKLIIRMGQDIHNNNIYKAVVVERPVEKEVVYAIT